MSNSIRRHGKSITEFLWLWVASILTILLTWLLFLINDNPLSFKELMHTAFLDGPVFAYISSTLAPFAYLIYRQFRDKNARQASIFSGVAVVITLIVLMIASLLFFQKRMSIEESNYQSIENSKIIAVISDADLDIFKSKINKSPKEVLTFHTRDYIAILIYFLSLIVFYYSIYRKNISPDDPTDQLREDSMSMKAKIDGLMERTQS
jgi:amino acid transporter